jgi:hypothetical protein
MISYEELCAALERYAANRPSDAPAVELPAMEGDARTSEHALPPVGGGEDEQVQPIYDDRSNELDIGDVLSDEEAPKN